MVPAFRVLAIFGLLHSLDALLPPVLFARYRPAFLFWCTGALLLVMPVAFWAGALSAGALGVAFAWVIVYPVIAAWMAREALREIDTDWHALWTELEPMTVASLLMAAGVLAVQLAIAGTEPFAVCARAGLSVAVGAAIYAAALRWRHPRLVGELMEVAGSADPETGSSWRGRRARPSGTR
jgi:O-antigen/teichoic acid export membrane protein